ncbi:MAG: C45 family autoproteolytic acyltransferase/hydrolase, partial [Candidatus Hydrogenedentes bacterium]|nr:C45 family autoproteolytic acyltransferase/hydrolase [Candidatus Hydrogenedentota bacterium]
KRLLAVSVCVIVLVVAFGWWYTHPGRGPRENVNPAEKAYVETVEGTTVLHVKGAPYEMGYQHGALLKEPIVKGMGAFHNLLKEGSKEIGAPVFALNFVLDCVYRRCAPYIPERYKREMEGVADGSGVSLRALRRLHVISEVTERNCSAFAVFNKATVDGKLYHGRNFDWNMDAGLQDNPVVILYEPDGQAPFASAGYPGLVGVLSGMSMKGICISQIGAVTRDGRSSGIPLMFLLRRLLEESRGVDDATRIVTHAHRTVGYNYVVSDGDRREARAYETTAHHCAVFTANDPRETVEYAIRIPDAVFRADDAMDRTVRRFQECSNGYPNMPYGSDSYDHRYKGMAKDIKAAFGKIDASVALDILKNAAMRDTNLHSVLCNVTDREMWVAHAKGSEDAWKQPYIHYDLKQLFLPPAQRTKP